MLKAEIISFAKQLGFQDVGFAKAVELTKEAKQLEKWLKENKNAEMHYMNNYFDLRIDPRKLFPNTKTVISLSHNYYNKENLYNNKLKISKYVYGNDYHKVIKKKLNTLISFIKTKVGNIEARGFVDSAPILERTWAKKSGIGWQGKNSLLLTKGSGSFFFLSEILLDIEFEYDHEALNYCNNCTKCIDACPTNAIVEPYVVDSNKCISYLTIENKSEIPEIYKGKFENWIYGCDICQNVCPINSRAKQTEDIDFVTSKDYANFSIVDLLDLDEEKYKTLSKNKAIKRAKFEGIRRNIDFIVK